MHFQHALKERKIKNVFTHSAAPGNYKIKTDEKLYQK